MSALFKSKDGAFYQAAQTYCIRNDMGTDFPLFACVHVSVGGNAGGESPGVICCYDKMDKNRLEIALADGSIKFYKSAHVHEFHESAILFTSLLSTTQVGG